MTVPYTHAFVGFRMFRDELRERYEGVLLLPLYSPLRINPTPEAWVSALRNYEAQEEDGYVPAQIRAELSKLALHYGCSNYCHTDVVGNSVISHCLSNGSGEGWVAPADFFFSEPLSQFLDVAFFDKCPNSGFCSRRSYTEPPLSQLLQENPDVAFLIGTVGWGLPRFIEAWSRMTAPIIDIIASSFATSGMHLMVPDVQLEYSSAIAQVDDGLLAFVDSGVSPLSSWHPA